MSVPAAVWWAQAISGEGAGDAAVVKDARQPAAEPIPKTEVPATRPAIPAAQKEQLVTAIELLGIVLLLGLTLLAVTIVVGWRMRRALSQPLPPAPRGDELWFLKKKSAGTAPDRDHKRPDAERN
jgi:hypothetical protein